MIVGQGYGAAIPVIEENLARLEKERESLQQVMKERGNDIDRLTAEQREDASRHTIVVAQANGLRDVLRDLQYNRRF